MTEPKITNILATARPGVAMIGRDEDHIALYLDCLEKQTFKDFEVAIADCYYRLREDHVKDNTYKGKTYPFTIHHFQVKSPWLDHGYWTGNAPWNQAAMLAKGELLCLYGDCNEQPPDYLERIWAWYQQGRWCMGLVVYRTGGRLALKDDLKDDGALGKYKDVLGEKTGILAFKKVQEIGWDLASNLLRDSRWPFVEKVPGGILFLSGAGGAQQFHGYSALPLQALLEVNGFDENMDGEKSLGDCDMGIRLYLAGYSNHLMLDRDVWIFENSHFAIPDDFLTYRGPSIRSNYSLMLLNMRLKRYKANSYRLTADEVESINKHALNWGFKDIDEWANPHFKMWLENPPIFNLRDLRMDMQDRLDDGITEIPEYYTWGK